MNQTYGQILKENRDFRYLFGGQLISELGNWFNYVAGLGLVRMVSNSSPEVAGLLLFWRTLPFAVLMPFAGALADRFSRRTILIVTDLLRAGFALLFLLITKPEHLWLAYFASILLSGATAFFEGAKNAATPNITGKDGLLPGTALMFSSRFLLMAVGSALGGLAAVYFGYKVAFIINAVSFVASAVSIWMIPAEAMREKPAEERRKEIAEGKRPNFFQEISEGIKYTLTNPLALSVLLMNIIWATGGGATNIVFEGLGTKVFTGYENKDFVFSALMTANGIGLGVGMFIAHRVEAIIERRKITNLFLGWSLVVHGILFAIAGFMPSLWLVGVFIIASRILIGAEYTIQETMFQRTLPDYIRGRISTLDRGAEITMFSISAYLAGISLTAISAQTLTLIAGLLAGSSGIVWLLRYKKHASYAQDEGVNNLDLEIHKSKV